MKKSKLRQIIKEEILNELKRSDYEKIYGSETIEEWYEIIKNIPPALKQAISDIDAERKDKYSERAPAMDKSGKHYIYRNVKGLPKTKWNKEIKSLLDNELFGFYSYYKDNK